MSSRPAYIFDTLGNEVVVELLDDLSIEVLLDIEDQWAASRHDMKKKLRAARVPLHLWPQSLHWNWAHKSLSLSFGDPDDHRVMAIRRQTFWEAAMVTLCKGHHARLASGAGGPLVYVDYLEVAPWNWPVPQVGQLRKYRAVGANMLRPAIEQSYAKGWDGRVGLHALPQATSFYESQGFAFVANDPEKQNLPYFELSAAAAKLSTGRR